MNMSQFDSIIIDGSIVPMEVIFDFGIPVEGGNSDFIPGRRNDDRRPESPDLELDEISQLKKDLEKKSKDMHFEQAIISLELFIL